MADTAINPGVGSISLTGLAPVVARGTNTYIYPDVGQLVLKNGAFDTNYGSATYGDPTYELMDFSGITVPTINQTLNVFAGPLSGVLGLTGYAPTIGQSNLVSTIGVGALTITGYAPIVQQVIATGYVPDVGRLTITGYAPSIAQPRSLTTDVGTISINGYSPGLGMSIPVQTGLLGIVGLAPAIAKPIVDNPGSGAVGIVGFAPTITQSRAVAVGTYGMSITGYAPSIAQPQGVHVALGTLSIVGYAPLVSVLSHASSPSAGAVTITGYPPSVHQFPSHIHRHVGKHTHRRPSGRIIVAND